MGSNEKLVSGEFLMSMLYENIEYWALNKKLEGALIDKSICLAGVALAEYKNINEEIGHV